MGLSRIVKICLLGVSLAIAQAPLHASRAEIDLGVWNSYATMAEQGAVCGAFADIMAMQSLVDEKLGRLWAERRNYSGSIIRRAASLEGLADINDDDIDILLNRYSMWLLNNLASPANAEILSPDARDAAREMVADVCATLYTQADKAIVQKHPALASCSARPAGDLSTEAGATPQQCDANEALLAAATVKKAETDLAGAVLRLSEEEDRRRAAQQRSQALEAKIATLHARLDALQDGADAARDTARRAVELNLENDQLKGEIARLNTEISGLYTVGAEKAAAIEQNTMLASRIETLETDIAALVQQLAATERRMSALPSPAELAAAKNDAATARTRLDRLAAELDTVRSERDDAVAAFDAALRPGSLLPAPVLNDSVATVDGMPTLTDSEMGITQSAGLTLLDSEADQKTATRPRTATDIDAASPEAANQTMFVAQLGAFRSRTGAANEIATLEQAFPDQLAAAGLNVTMDRRADGQNLFRIMTSGMTAEEAKQLCSRLWDRMVGCMVKIVP